uniref:Uncharacterized protein n=1 Tax=Romanomermis culicivorax TaxID=13658 RepID=A0A915L5R4_ROMCU
MTVSLAASQVKVNGIEAFSILLQQQQSLNICWATLFHGLLVEDMCPGCQMITAGLKILKDEAMRMAALEKNRNYKFWGGSRATCMASIDMFMKQALNSKKICKKFDVQNR